MTRIPALSHKRLEEQDRDQLLATVRSVLVEAEALSSRIAAVNEISIAINRTLNLEEILQIVAKQAKWLLDFEHCSVCLQNEAFAWRIVTLFGTPFEADLKALMETSPVGEALKTGQSRLVIGAEKATSTTQFASQMIIPLVSEEIIMGSINFGAKAAGAYTQDDLRIGYMLALQLSAAIRNARLFDELKRAEAEMRRYAAELEATNQQLDAYNHTIAHDLKSPLTGIILNADFVQMTHKDDLPAKSLERLDSIRNSSLKMSTMIGQLLTLAKLRDVMGTATRVEMKAVVTAALARFNHLIENGHITIEEAPDFPPAMGHAQWIEEVFANLISNAIKYMGDDNPAPRISICGKREGAMVRYEVQDSGVGIKRSDQARLFEMFTRLHTVKADGLGLGLSIVHRIITQLGGKIGVKSARGKGSTFWFTLPAAED